MNEKEIHHHIDELVTEEHTLRQSGLGLSPEQRTRLTQLETQLDQAWDLLRQRQARSEFGQDPNAAAERPVNEVEGYRQ